MQWNCSGGQERGNHTGCVQSLLALFDGCKPYIKCRSCGSVCYCPLAFRMLCNATLQNVISTGGKPECCVRTGHHAGSLRADDDGAGRAREPCEAHCADTMRPKDESTMGLGESKSFRLKNRAWRSTTVARMRIRQAFVRLGTLYKVVCRVLGGSTSATRWPSLRPTSASTARSSRTAYARVLAPAHRASVGHTPRRRGPDEPVEIPPDEPLQAEVLHGPRGRIIVGFDSRRGSVSESASASGARRAAGRCRRRCRRSRRALAAAPVVVAVQALRRRVRSVRRRPTGPEPPAGSRGARRSPSAAGLATATARPSSRCLSASPAKVHRPSSQARGDSPAPRRRRRSRPPRRRRTRTGRRPLPNSYRAGRKTDPTAPTTKTTTSGAPHGRNRLRRRPSRRSQPRRLPGDVPGDLPTLRASRVRRTRARRWTVIVPAGAVRGVLTRPTRHRRRLQNAGRAVRRAAPGAAAARAALPLHGARTAAEQTLRPRPNSSTGGGLIGEATKKHAFSVSASTSLASNNKGRSSNSSGASTEGRSAAKMASNGVGGYKSRRVLAAEAPQRKRPAPRGHFRSHGQPARARRRPEMPRPHVGAGAFEADRTPNHKATTRLKSTPTARHSPIEQSRVIGRRAPLSRAHVLRVPQRWRRAHLKDGAKTKNMENARETLNRLPNNALWRGEQIIKKTPHRL